MAWKAAECGVQGLTVRSEVSPYHTATGLSDFVFARLGGDTAASRFLEHVGVLDRNPSLDASILANMQAEATDAARNFDDEARRWLWLAERAARRRYGKAWK